MLLIIFLNSCTPDYLKYKDMIGYTTYVAGYNELNDFYWKKEYAKYQFEQLKVNFLEFNCHTPWQNEYISFIIYRDNNESKKCHIIIYDAIIEIVQESDFNDNFFKEFLQLNDCDKTISDYKGHSNVMRISHDSKIEVEYKIDNIQNKYHKYFLTSNNLGDCEQKQIEFIQDQLLYYYFILQ